MDVILIQHGEDVSQELEEELKKRIETVQLKTITSNDPFDALAQAKKHLEDNQIITMFIELDDDKKELKEGFYNGLSYLQVNTGKEILKETYTTMEKPEIEKMAEKIAEKIL